MGSLIRLSFYLGTLAWCVAFIVATCFQSSIIQTFIFMIERGWI